jgi:SAM-dependent methyltransferase
MGYVFDYTDAIACHQWYQLEDKQNTAALQKRLFIDMLRPTIGDTFLDIGCGTGQFLQYLAKRGIDRNGLDPSPYMIDIASKNLGAGVTLQKGFAEDLPFDDNTFTCSALISVLEFVDDPQKSLEEAFRVTKNRVFIGFFNRYGLHRLQRRIKTCPYVSAYRHARLFSIWELKQMIYSIMGDIPVEWGTSCFWPTLPARITSGLIRSDILQHCPFGSFAGITVTLLPRFRTRPMELKVARGHPSNATIG